MKEFCSFSKDGISVPGLGLNQKLFHVKEVGGVCKPKVVSLLSTAEVV